jgi:hypothetical protein
MQSSCTSDSGLQAFPRAVEDELIITWDVRVTFLELQAQGIFFSMF